MFLIALQFLAERVRGFTGAEAVSLLRRTLQAVRRANPRWLANDFDDVVQNILLRFLLAVQRRTHVHKFSARYLRRAAHAALVNETRRLCQRKETPLERVDPASLPIDAEMSPEQLAAAGETVRWIQECLGRLRPERRSAVSLYLQGFGLHDTAEQMHVKEKKAENLIYRGLNDLRRELRAVGVSV